MPDIAAILGMFLVFGIPLSAIWTSHFRKMAEIKAKSGGDSGDTAKHIAALRQEIAALRETTTRFDMSFDAALSRVEERLNTVEEKQATAVGYSAGQWQPTPTSEREAGTVHVGQR